jgi:hypothetical protein
MGRKSTGTLAMSGAERQRRYYAKRKAAGLLPRTFRVPNDLNGAVDALVLRFGGKAVVTSVLKRARN